MCGERVFIKEKSEYVCCSYACLQLQWTVSVVVVVCPLVARPSNISRLSSGVWSSPLLQCVQLVANYSREGNLIKGTPGQLAGRPWTPAAQCRQNFGQRACAFPRFLHVYNCTVQSKSSSVAVKTVAAMAEVSF